MITKRFYKRQENYVVWLVFFIGGLNIPSKCLIVGSVAFDLIMEIIPTIRDEIPLVDGKIKSLNLCFVSPKTPRILRGGTAGNIAFGISYLGGRPVLFSVVGNDFQETYGNLLEKQNVVLMVETDPNDITARSYQITDSNNEQIIIWEPNAIRSLEDATISKHKNTIEASQIAVANFSPGSAESTVNHMNETAKIYPEAILIFDPGQMVMTYTEDQFKECLNLSDLIILNDAEVLKSRKRGLYKETFREEYQNLILIETLGAKGAHYFMPDGTEWLVGTVPDVQIVEPTGAGDAFRSGLIYAFLEIKNDWIQAGCYGAALASLCIEASGAQGYDIKSRKEVLERAKLVTVTQIK
ncbi:MAG: PfkB family carbohydrate kinase [Candidatus Hodarchaeales archaeon]